ncbi:hypothetical protein E2C01_081777 [Portunus trituberculatus]|uniref:Uncharacterized protein n=1 Tax=Portunus trituberculatus TaxID=210409 RepID=A0A5B7J381_PORTR|nr:hypothetical protein [Portunus trituberculatus]
MCQEGRLSGVTFDPWAIKGPDPGGIWGQVAAHPSPANPAAPTPLNVCEAIKIVKTLAINVLIPIDPS